MSIFKTEQPKRKDDAFCERSFNYEYNQKTNLFPYSGLIDAWTTTLEGKSDIILGRNKNKTKKKK